MATLSELEPNDSFSNANILSLGNSAMGSVSSVNDWDYFKVTMNSSGVLKLGFTSPVTSSSDYFNMVVYDASGKRLAYDFVTSSTSLSVGAPVAGNYYVAVTSGSTHYTVEQYTLGVSLGAGSAADFESENNGSLVTADSILLEHTIKGQLSSSSDADYYRVTATAAGVLVLDFSAPHNTADSSCTVSIYDKDGNLLENRQTGNATSLVVPVAAAGSDYYVRVSQGQAINFDSGNYSFTAHNDSLASLAAKTLNGVGSIALTLSTGHDWYAVNLTAGTSYEFGLAGASSGGGTLADPSLTLSYASGTTLAACDNLAVWSGTQTTTVLDPQIAFTAPITGTYYLMIGGNGGTGTYTLSEKTDASSSLQQALLHLQQDLLPLQNVPIERWNGGSPLGTPVSLTYSFMTSAADGATEDKQKNFAPMNAAQKLIVEKILKQQYGAIANITFTETTNQTTAQIRFGLSDQSGSSGITYTSQLNNDTLLEQADVFIDYSAGMPGFSDGSYSLLTLIHEIGHALGLKHPGNYDAGGGSSLPPYLPLAWDNHKFATMSYVDNPDVSVYGDTPGLLDIAAVQYLYGANTSALGRTSTYQFSNSKPFVSSLMGSGSNDTIDISNQSLASTVLLTPGTLSSIGVDANGDRAKDNLTVPFGEKVVSVIDGPAADLIVGNTLDNSFYGFAGKDTLDGGTGNDQIVLTATSASLNAAIDAEIANVETVTANGAVSAVTIDLHRQNETISIVGGASNDVLTGGSGNDTLTGGAGADTMSGGAGYDTYSVDKVADVVVESAADNSPAATANVNLGVFDDPIGLRLQKFYLAYYGRAADYAGLVYWQNTLFNKLSNDQLQLCSYFGNAQQTEYVGLYGANPTEAQFLDNVYQNLFSRAADNLGRDYWSGVIADKLKAGTLLDVARAQVVIQIIDGALGADSTLIDSKITANTALSKEIAQADASGIYSTATSTSAFAVARAWTQEQQGGVSPERVLSDYVAAQILGHATGDQVTSSVTYTLPANVENLSLSGSLDLGASGNTLDNIITGNSGTNFLTGGGVLNSSDAFVFATAPNAAHVDTIIDFTPGTDVIILVRSSYAALAAGPVSVQQGTATQAAATLLFNNSVLSYDADGSGLLPATSIAVLSGVATLPAGAVWVV